MIRHSKCINACSSTCIRPSLRITRMFTLADGSEKTINTLLDYVSASAAVSPDHLQAFYDAPKELAPKPLYERVKIKLKLKLARTWLSRCAWSRLETVQYLTLLHRHFKTYARRSLRTVCLIPRDRERHFLNCCRWKFRCTIRWAKQTW